MDSLREAVRREVEGYAVDMLNGTSYMTANADQTVFAVISVGQVRECRFAFADLIVRLDHDRVVIEHDANSKPLVAALLAAGIPRGKIILAYAGEPVDSLAAATG